jgi:hypothetical protein
MVLPTIGPKSICAVIPTRGDVEMDEIVNHLKSFPEIGAIRIIIGTSTFNRYLAAMDARQEIIFTQDDDCVTDLLPIIRNYEPGVIVNAMTPDQAKRYKGAQTLIGYGAIFDRALVESMMDEKWIHDDLFYSKADRIFTTINPHHTVFPRIRNLPHATAENRLYNEHDHGAKVIAMNQRIKEITGIKA